MDMIKFECNICGQQNKVHQDQLGRETGSCSKCNSTVRMRSIVHLLSMELFGESLSLTEMNPDKSIVGMGMSDWEPYAKPLAKLFSYTNTYYDREPMVDITNPDPSLIGTLDFLISTDVFEHVAPPVEIAFVNARKLLKPDGVFVFSVPFSLAEQTVEHFPELHEFTITKDRKNPVLINTTRDGRTQEFRDLVFHGGEGATLEMRVFNQLGLEEQLSNAGFAKPEYHTEPCWERGIYFPQQWSLPLVTRPQPVLSAT